MNKGEGEANLFLEIFFTPCRPKFILLLLLYRDDIISIPKSKSFFRFIIYFHYSIVSFFSSDGKVSILFFFFKEKDTILYSRF